MYEQELARQTAAMVKPTTLREELEQENRMLQSRIDTNAEMIKLLNENPAIEKFMNLSRKR